MTITPKRLGTTFLALGLACALVAVTLGSMAPRQSRSTTASHSPDQPPRAASAATKGAALTRGGDPAGAALPASPWAPEPDAPKGGAPGAQSEPRIKADRNGNKIFDDLETRLGSMAPDGRVGVITTLPSPASQAAIDQLRSQIGDFSVGHRFSIINGFAATMTRAQIEALARLGGVGHVEEDSVVRASNQSAQDSFGVTKARADNPALDGDKDGSTSYSGADLVAAVIDTGIDANHKDLDGGKVLEFKDYVGGKATPYDDNGHGTHVAATIAGDGGEDGLHQGVAPRAGLVGVKVLDSGGSGSMSDVTAAIEWVSDNATRLGIEAINLSLGASGCSDGTDATSVAVDKAADAGLVVAVAAGNEGSGTCTIGSPGAARKAMTVGAMADMGVNGFKQAYFSSRGKTADGRIKPDVSAPGVAITSAKANTTEGYVDYSGTSMATPFVAGVSLLMRDATSGLTSADVKGKAMQTAVDWGRGGDNKTAGSTGVDIDYGAGRLDAHGAIKAAGGTSADGPAAPVHELKEGSLPGSGAVVDYKLDVSDIQFPVAATLIHPSISRGSASSPDFDLYLFDPNGKEVAYAETTRRQEEIGFKPTLTGVYTLRVRSWSGSGPYFVDVSFGSAPDTTAPTVTQVSPAENAVDVPTTTNVSVTFDEPMDATATEPAFSLATGSTTVAGKLSWSGNTLVFDPDSDLTKGAVYTATLTTAATDRAGNPLEAGKTWSFTITTATEPTTVTANPGATTVEPGGGTYKSGTASSLNAVDSYYYTVSSTTSGTRTSSWYGSFTGVSNALSKLEVTYRGKNSRKCVQTVDIWNWATGQWVQLDRRYVSSTEIQIVATPGGTLADYVSGTTGDGELRLRVRSTNSRNFSASGNFMRIVYDRP